tara:strand:+ start:14221 stop:15162 length:942 start_codon:yes stop_codon:yes gene_type:complete
MTRLTVAIPTFRRPDALNAALESAVPQAQAIGAQIAGVEADILIIDNDPDASARSLAENWPVRYVHEPIPGIAAVRNRALDESTGVDAIVFIDDDEVPEHGWLAALTDRYLTTGADAVAGRVVTIFPDETEPWVRASGAFVRPRRVDGQMMPEAATNNLLLDLANVRRNGLRFDAAFGLTGGSDSLFTARLVAAGGIIRWCEDAVVIEREDPVRFTKRWVLMRTFRFGNTWSRVRIALATSPVRRAGWRARAALTGIVRVAQGALLWAAGTIGRSAARRARALRTIYRGAGNVAGAVGYAHDEYGRRRRAMGL